MKNDFHSYNVFRKAKFDTVWDDIIMAPSKSRQQ